MTYDMTTTTTTNHHHHHANRVAYNDDSSSCSDSIISIDSSNSNTGRRQNQAGQRYLSLPLQVFSESFLYVRHEPLLPLQLPQKVLHRKNLNPQTRRKRNTTWLTNKAGCVKHRYRCNQKCASRNILTDSLDQNKWLNSAHCDPTIEPFNPPCVEQWLSKKGTAPHQSGAREDMPYCFFFTCGHVFDFKATFVWLVDSSKVSITSMMLGLCATLLMSCTNSASTDLNLCAHGDEKKWAYARRVG